ncbi:MAG: DUF2304 domain-containing protein [Pirellulales bacterium]
MPPFGFFQWIAFAVLSAALVRELLVWTYGRQRRLVVVGRAALLAAAGWFVAFPDQSTVVAKWAGIGRGADLVMYVYVFFSLGALFLLYARCVRLERQVTAIVRWEALHAAECPEKAPVRESNDDDV